MSDIKYESALRSSKAYDLIVKDLPNRLSHAYMIVSQDNEIIEEFFKLVACAIYCETNNACLECPNCVKVIHNNHEDILHLYPQNGKSISVPQVNSLIDDVYIKSYTGKKICFIHNAEQMSVIAQNKLLKTFEEPPEEVTIFLGVSNESIIIDTIKSRAKVINIDLFDEKTIVEALISIGCDKETASIAAACSEGLIGKAKQIAASSDYTNMYENVFDLLTRLNKSSDIASLSSIVTSQVDMNQFFDVLSIVLRDMLTAKENSNLIVSKHENSRIIELSNKFSTRALAEILLKINDERKKLAILPQKTIGGGITNDLLFYVLEARYKWQ